MPGSVTLQQTLESIAALHHGDVALFAENLKTGETVGIHPDEAVPTASVIKLAILYAAMQQVRAGAARLDDPLIMRKDDQVPRSGALLFFDTPMTLTLKDALTMMIVLSDNTATNLVIDHIGFAAINSCIQKIGLKNTCLYRKALRPAEASAPEDHKRFGLGKTTPREIAQLMQKIISGDFSEQSTPSRAGDEHLRDLMLYMLRNQFYQGSIPRYLGAMYTDTDSLIANKTGELNAVRNDVAAIDSNNGMLILSIFTYNNHDQSWSVENEGCLTIAKLAKAIVATWSPEDLQNPNF